MTPYWIERRFRAMGSNAHLLVGDADEKVVDWASRELERLEQCWSRFRPDSELSRLNAAAGTWVEVSPTLAGALGCAAELWEATEGAFDPTVLGALERSGYDRSFESVAPSGPDVAPPSPVPGFGAVDRDESAVRLPVGTGLDLGGLGKGLAADLVAEGLVDRGARTALVSLGGDVRACGEPPEPAGWSIPVEDPFTDARTLFEHRLTDGALVTSTRLMRTWSRGGRRYHHIFDPATGAPAERGVAAVVVHATRAFWAEGLAKAALVVGPDDGASLIERSGAAGWIFCDGGSTVVTAREVLGCSPS